MSFYYPLGLLGLLGIPVIVLIYIIKSKYTEQTVASTYLWELSETFLKKKKRVSKLTGIVSLILQILVVLTASLLIAHPVFIIPDSANDIYFILDGSASMNMSSGNTTRFERAQEKINSLIDGSLGGSTYTLIYVSDAVNVSFEGVSDKEQAKTNVNALSAGWSEADCISAVNLAQSMFDTNNSAIFYLVTDKAYDTNMELIDVSKGENNYALYEYGYQYNAEGLCGTGMVISYRTDATLTVEMYITAGNSEETKVAQTTVAVKAGEPAAFEVQAEALEFTSLRLKIADADAMEEDNTVVLYDEAKSQERKVLFINNTEDGAYLYNAITGAGKAEVNVVTPKQYAETPAVGYGLYVFNGYTPAELPKNAAIWLINAVDGSGTGSGVTFRDVQTPRDETGPESYFVPEYTTGTSSQEKQLLNGLVKREIAVRQYARYGLPRSFVSILNVGGDSLVSVGLNSNNDREVVFAFEIGDSNFGMLDDFLILVKNLMNYSFPSVIDETVYECGSIMNVNVVPGCQNIVVTTPSGRSTTLDTLDNSVCEVSLTETGTYTIFVKLETNTEDMVYYAYACVPESESRSEGGGTVNLSGERTENYSDGFYDKLLAFFIIISLLLLADWGVYCYEQYQLR